MQFNPIKQFNTILQHEYLEPTISWSFRVVLALNIPLLIFPLFFGFSYLIVYSAFAAYMLTLIDYRGTHYRKMLIQAIEGVLILIAAVIGMNVGNSMVLSVVGMVVIGIFAALIRNWSDYGSTIGVGVGFFYLFGLANPTSFWESLHYAQFIVYGSLWAIAIIFISFPFSASNPIRRSVGNIWRKNTELLDELIAAFLSEKSTQLDWKNLLAKEADIRSAVDKSIELFNRRKENARFKAIHYDQMIEMRRIAAFFGANSKLILDELTELNQNQFPKELKTILYKTLSALSQTTARLSILVFTNRGEDFTLATVRLKRFETAVGILNEKITTTSENNPDELILKQLITRFEQAASYLQETLELIEEKNKFKRSHYAENYKLSFNHFISGLQPRVVWQIMSEMFNVDSQQFQYALRVAIGLGFSVFLYKYFHIDHGHWIALTLLIVIQPYYGATRKKAIERIIGTVAGIVVGGMIMLFPLPKEAFVVILIVISFFVAYFLRNNYKVGVFFVTIMMVVLMQLSQQGSWELILWRVMATAIGALTAILISFAFWPIWEKQRFPNLQKESLKYNLTYLKEVVINYVQLETSNVAWHKSRRLAEGNNNNLFACVQRMYEEPANQRKEIDIHFAKVGSNIRITREITSLAFQLEHTAKNRYLAEVLTEFTQAVTETIEKLLKEEKPIDLSNIQSFLTQKSSLLLPEHTMIKVELEKILFELNAISAFRG